MERNAGLYFGNLRLARFDFLAEYLVNTSYWKRAGNAAFALAIRNNTLPRSISAQIAEDSNHPWVLYHSWLPGILNLVESEAEFVRGLMARTHAPASIIGNGDHRNLLKELIRRGWCNDDPVDIDYLVSRHFFVAIQNHHELNEFLKLVQIKRPRVVLEIGTARGGVLYCFSQLARSDSLIVSIDLPGAPNCGGQTEGERALFSTFGPPTQKFQFLPADSHDPATRQKLAELLAGRKIDLLFIDGDHSYEGVRLDFEMYHQFVAEDGILAIHDIQLFPENCGSKRAVGVFWKELKKRYKTREIIDPNGSIPRLTLDDSGPELLDGNYPPAWGIGIVDLSCAVRVCDVTIH